MTHKNINFQNLKSLDERKINKSHVRMVITAGMGFFTDAYDLFIIGVVTALLIPLWHLSIKEVALLNGVSLLAAALGAITFGWLADKFGRKKMYGVEVLILFIGAILSAISPSYIWLLISRVLVGFGIGGDYPTSAVVASEHSNRKNRGYLVLMVFAMQAIGLILGPMIASLLIKLHLPHEVIWRSLLAFGAIPAASVFYLRRNIAETPRFLLTKTTPVEVSRVVSELSNYHDDVSTPTFTKMKTQKLFSPKLLRYLFGTAGAWFLFDIVFYGNGISSVMIMKSISPHASLLRHTLTMALIFLCFAVPGYLLAAKYVDAIGRKKLQILGFSMIMLCYLLIAWFPQIQNHMPLFIMLYGLSFFFSNFGPNATTFLIPSEIFPTNVRARAHGISAAVGKVGAFLGALLLPLILHMTGLSIVMNILAVVAFIGIGASLLVPEMKKESLETTETFCNIYTKTIGDNT